MLTNQLVAEGTNIFSGIIDFLQKQFDSFQGVANFILVVAIFGIGISLLTEGGRRKIMPALPYIIIGFVLLFAANNIAGAIGNSVTSEFSGGALPVIDHLRI